MWYPQNGDLIVTINTVTSLQPMYCEWQSSCCWTAAFRNFHHRRRRLLYCNYCGGVGGGNICRHPWISRPLTGAEVELKGFHWLPANETAMLCMAAAVLFTTCRFFASELRRWLLQSYAVVMLLTFIVIIIIVIIMCREYAENELQRHWTAVIILILLVKFSYVLFLFCFFAITFRGEKKTCNRRTTPKRQLCVSFSFVFLISCFWTYPNFLLAQCRIGGKKLPGQKQAWFVQPFR